MKKKFQDGGSTRQTKGQALTRSKVTASGLLSEATGKLDLNENDIRQLAIGKGYSKADTNAIVKGFNQSKGKSIEFMSNMKDFNVFDDTKGGAVGSGKKTGNKKGFDAGDLIGLGNNVNKFAGFAASLKGAKKEQAVQPEAQTEDQPWLNTEGSNAKGTAAKNLADSKFSWEGVTPAKGKGNTGGKGTPTQQPRDYSAELKRIAELKKEWATKDAVPRVKMIKSAKDFLTFGNSSAPDYEFDKTDQIFREGATQTSAREQTSVYSPEQHKILWDNYKKAKSQGIDIKPEDLVNAYKRFGNEMFLEAAITMSTGALGTQYRAGKEALNPLLRYSAQTAVPSAGIISKVASKPNKAVAEVAKKTNIVAKDLNFPIKKLPAKTVKPKATTVYKGTNPNSEIVKQRSAMMDEGYAKGGKLYGQSGVKTPKITDNLEYSYAPSDVPQISGRNVGYSIVPKFDWKASFNKRVANDALTGAIPSERATREIKGPGKGLNINTEKAGNTLGQIAKYALPFIGERIARKQLDRIKPVKFEAAQLMTGAVQDLGRNFKPMMNRTPSGPDQMTNLAGQKAVDSFNRDQEFKWNLANEASKMQQRENILNRTNQGVMFNTQGKNQANMFNAQLNAGTAGIRYQSVREPFLAGQHHLASDISSAALLKGNKEASEAELMVKYPEAFGGAGSEEYKRRLNELGFGIPKPGINAKKGGKMKIKSNC